MITASIASVCPDGNSCMSLCSSDWFLGFCSSPSQVHISEVSAVTGSTVRGSVVWNITELLFE